MPAMIAPTISSWLGPSTHAPRSAGARRMKLLTYAEENQKVVVRYRAGTYSGTRTVWAADETAAIDKVRRAIRKEMTLPMYSDSYRVVDGSDDDDE